MKIGLNELKSIIREELVESHYDWPAKPTEQPEQGKRWTRSIDNTWLQAPDVEPRKLAKSDEDVAAGLEATADRIEQGLANLEDERTIGKDLERIKWYREEAQKYRSGEKSDFTSHS